MPRKANIDHAQLVCSSVNLATAKVKGNTSQDQFPQNGQLLEDDEARQRLTQREYDRRQDQRRQAHTVKQIEEILGIGHSTAYQLFNSGALKARKLLGKTIVLDSDLQAFLASLPAFGEVA